MFSISKHERIEHSQRSVPEFSNSLIDGAHVSAITKSRDRCRSIGLRDNDRPDHSAISKADFSISRERSLRLFRHAAPIMEILYEQIINTHSTVLLTDDQGTILHGIGDNDFLAKAEKVALMPGVNWAENKKGTNGMGTALIDERPTLVHAGEHYLSANHFLTCSAAPIFDPRGDLLGVLDVTSDHRSYHQHTMGLVKMSARMIENDWFNDNFRESLRLYIHPRAEFLGTLMQGILAISRDGRILGANRCAVELLGMSPAALRMHSLSSLLGTTIGAIVDHARQSGSMHFEPLSLSTTSGLMVHTRAELTWAPVLAASTSGVYIDEPLLHHARAPEQIAPSVKPDASPVNPTTNHQHGSYEAASPEKLVTQRRVSAVPAASGRLAGELAALNSGDAQLANVLDKVRRVLNKNIPVLILGETGTGKELLARALHADSERASQPFIAVNCASIPDTLIESELFGYEEGAFTGARKKGAAGKILQAHGGTLFLDEIGDMPLQLQAHLLRVLQERQVTPLGGNKAVDVDVAIVCATHRDLRGMIENHSFREDLYYRLNGLAVRLPPLRQRSDIAALVRSILTRLAEEEPDLHAQRLSLASNVMSLFQTYSWPGNVRQLVNVLRTAAVMAVDEGEIHLAHLSDDFLEEAALVASTATLASNGDASSDSYTTAQHFGEHSEQKKAESVPQTLEELEIATIRSALDAAGGNISVASKKLGISRNTIYRKLRWNQPKLPA
jgi:sigma-54 dependent transcriptional regulator, acetoin dehydrogenase operon transcriptional activator AcoR